MATNRGGGDESVSFTKDAARRIADTVRFVEQGNRDTYSPVSSPRATGGGGGSAIRLCTFTGAWAIGGTKTCTIKETTNEIEVKNYFHHIGADCGQRDCAVAKVKSEWILIAAQCG
jgi:hypothetical protein